MRPANARFLKTALFIILITSLVYANALRNSFVWDDYIIIVENDFVKSCKNLPLVFSKAYLASIQDIKSGRFSGAGETTYRPVVTLTYFIDYALWGLNPFGYHLSNLLLHLLNAILLYILVMALTKDEKIAFLASILFSLHPINAEAVGVVSFREDTLAFTFFILSFLLYVKTHRGGAKVRLYYLASLFLFVLALFSKEMAITLPLLLVAYDYFFVCGLRLKETFRRFRPYYLGYALSVAFFLWVWCYIKGNISEYVTEYPFPGGSLFTGLLTMAKVVVAYIGWLVFPFNIHTTFPETEPALTAHSILDPGFLLSAALILACFVFALKARRPHPKISFAVLWFFITLLPALNIVPVSNIMASRYLYLPAAGFAIALACLLRILPECRAPFLSARFLRSLARDAVVVLAVCYSMVTFIRNMAWRDNLMVWGELAEYYPHNFSVRLNLGHELRKAGHFSAAIEAYTAALQLGAPAAEVYNNLGRTWGEKGYNMEAVEYFKKAISADPSYADAYNNLAVVMVRIGQWDEARALWLKVLQLVPAYREARINLEKLEGLKGSTALPLR